MSVDRTEAEKLRSVPLFAGCSGESLAKVAALIQPFEVPAGHVLVQPGQPGQGMFVIEEGDVVVEREGHPPIGFGSGEVVGELAILADVTRTARVRATTPVKGWAIARQDFSRLLDSEPQIAVAMLGVLARRLAETD